MVRPHFEEVVDLELPSPEHVVCLGNFPIIEAEGGERVEPRAAKQNRLVLEKFRRDLEVALVGPILLADPLDSQLVVPEKWIFDFSGSQQVGVDAARHGGGNPLTLARFRHRPFSPEIECFQASAGDRRVSKQSGKNTSSNAGSPRKVRFHGWVKCRVNERG